MSEALGLRPEVSTVDYHADRVLEHPTLSRSAAWTIATESPLHCWQQHPRLGGATQDVTPEMDFGDVAHALMLGKGAEIAVGNWNDYRTNDAKAFREQARAEGKTPILAKTNERANVLYARLRLRLNETGWPHAFIEGANEAVIVWREGAAYCRAMLDNLILRPDSAEIHDLKTCESANPAGLDKKVWNLGYHFQAFWNVRAVEAAYPNRAGRVKFYFHFAESQPPFDVVSTQLDGEFMALGASVFSRALERWTRCVSSGKWPGYASPERLTPPPYALAAEMSASL